MRDAVVAVLRRDDRVLVIQRGPAVTWAGHWTLPSGRVEVGETHEKAVVREVREELGLHVKPVGKIWECPTDDGQYLLHWWAVDWVSNELRLEPGEVGDTRWVTADEFFGLEPTFAGDRDFFRRVLPGLRR